MQWRTLIGGWENGEPPGINRAQQIQAIIGRKRFPRPYILSPLFKLPANSFIAVYFFLLFPTFSSTFLHRHDARPEGTISVTLLSCTLLSPSASISPRRCAGYTHSWSTHPFKTAYISPPATAASQKWSNSTKEWSKTIHSYSRPCAVSEPCF